MYCATQLNKIIDRREFLKIKIKSLAAEAQIIRKAEKKMQGPLREEMHSHRVLTVRWAARSTHIAYGLIRGRTLAQMENKSATEPHWKSIESMLKAYGPRHIDLQATKAQGLLVITL